MKIIFYPVDENTFKKEAINNTVVMEVTNLLTKEVTTYKKDVKNLWSTSCKNNIRSDHRIKKLKGDNYIIKCWIEKKSIITYWVASSNPKIYDSLKAFKEHKIIDWGNRSNNKIKEGDIVYIYITKPIQKIAIKTEVIKSNYSNEDLLDSEDFFDREEKNIQCNNFIRLKLLEFLDSDKLTLQYLNENGLNGNIQGKRTLDGLILSYIKSNERLATYDLNELDEYYKKELESSKSISPKKRLKKLKEANKIPEKINIISKGYKRNPDVITEVLLRADGICEHCKNKAPFLRKTNNTPYLEVHHKKPLSEGGEDTIENAIAVCPNCHRYLHYGKD